MFYTPTYVLLISVSTYTAQPRCNRIGPSRRKMHTAIIRAELQFVAEQSFNLWQGSSDQNRILYIRGRTSHQTLKPLSENQTINPLSENQTISQKSLQSLFGHCDLEIISCLPWWNDFDCSPLCWTLGLGESGVEHLRWDNKGGQNRISQKADFGLITVFGVWEVGKMKSRLYTLTVMKYFCNSICNL